MPCTDGNATPQDYKDAHRFSKYETELSNLKKDVERFKRNQRLAEAGLCAVFTELEKRGILDDVIENASRDGVINLSKFWAIHKKNDKRRLIEEFNRFSQQEKEVIKRLINDGTI